MNKHLEKKSLKNFKKEELTKKQAQEVNGAWLSRGRSSSSSSYRSPFESLTNYICYGNVNGIENRRW